jgi:glycosyltransferase involved in cell wall biosynthesis
MNAARPAVGCRVGGPAEIVADGLTGLLLPPESPDDLAAALIRLLDNPEERRAMGLAGRQRLLEHFSHSQMAQSYVEFYYQRVTHDCGPSPSPMRMSY